MTILPMTLSELVIPVDNPVVPKAEVTSTINEMSDWFSVILKIKTAIRHIKMDKLTTTIDF